MAWLAQYRDVSIFIASEPLAGDDLALFRKARIMRPDVLRVLLTPNMDQPQLGQAVELETVNHLLQMPFGEESLLDLICPEAAGISVTPQRLLA
jgi:hypothetical protein